MWNFIKEELPKEAKKEWNKFLNRLDRPARVVPTFIKIEDNFYNINTIIYINPKPFIKPDTGEKYWCILIKGKYYSTEINQETYDQLVKLLRID